MMKIKTLGFLCLFGGVVSFSSCKNDQEQESDAQVPRDGKALAQAHCARCHLCPDPGDLPQPQWEFVLRWMGHYVGMEKEADSYIEPLLAPGLMATEPLLKEGEWAAIKRYFLQGAKPEQAPEEVMADCQEPSDLFAPGDKFSSTQRHQVIPAFHLIEDAEDGLIVLVSNASTKEVLRFNREGRYQGRRGSFETETVGFFEHEKKVGMVQIWTPIFVWQ